MRKIHSSYSFGNGGAKSAGIRTGHEIGTGL
jgi:hypothetical protein